MTKQEIFKKFGNQLITQGVKFLQGAFNVKPQQFPSSYIAQIIMDRTGLTRDKIYFADDTYYVVDIATIKDILKYDLADEKEYEAEKFDCDDFAATIYAIFRYVFELNSMGLARTVEMRDVATNQLKAWHRANIFVATDNNILKVYVLEPQTDQIVELNSVPPRNDVIFGNTKYVFHFFDF